MDPGTHARRGGLGGRGRAHFRDRSFSPTNGPRQRASPVYESFGQRGRCHATSIRGRRDDFESRDETTRRGLERFDRRRPSFDRPGFDRGYGGLSGGCREVSERDRDSYPYNEYGAGPPGYPHNQRGGPESPEFDRYGAGGTNDILGRRISHNLGFDDRDAPPLSKVMFIKRIIEDDLPESEIDKRYTEYLATKFRSKNKAEFERQKNDDAFKRRFDPFVFKEEVEGRARTAQTTAIAFGKDLAEGKYDWRAEGRQQLLLPSEYKKALQAKTAAPVISWHPRIIACCWKISCRLIVKLDKEKRVRRDYLSWIGCELEPLHGNQEQKQAGTTEHRSNDNSGDSYAAAHELKLEGTADINDEPSATAQTMGNLNEDYLLQDEDLDVDSVSAKTGQLDVMLEYLWQVHGVDFYSGADGELGVEVYKTVKERLKRTSPEVEFRCMRTHKPQSGALVDDRKRDQVMEEFFHIVARPWIERLKRVDPDTQKAFDLERQLEAAVDIAVATMLQNSKAEDRQQVSYRCTFCSKKFKGEDYLKKHINNKHDTELSDFKDSERNKAREEIFFESFEMHQAQEEETCNVAIGHNAPSAHPVVHGMHGVIGPIPFMNPMVMQVMQMLNGRMTGMGPAGVGMGQHIGINRVMMEQGAQGRTGGRGVHPDRIRGGPRSGRAGRSMRGSGQEHHYYDFDSAANQRDQLNYGDI